MESRLNPMVQIHQIYGMPSRNNNWGGLGTRADPRMVRIGTGPPFDR